MPYLVHLPTHCPWLVAELWGRVDSADIVGVRQAMADANGANAYSNFVFDFSGVSEMDMTLDVRDGVRAVDHGRRLFIPDGKCAFVASRETVEIGVDYLAGVSTMDVEFRTFPTRSGAEAWLSGEAPETGLRAPNRHRSKA